ncbi:unnamed protein product [Fusarium fujikuroi]|nr:unnamed protein product [Fusarium fujikuroi]
MPSKLPILSLRDPIFKGIQKKIGDGVGKGIYNSYPRVIGETGGKNWGVVHSSADVKNVAF